MNYFKKSQLSIINFLIKGDISLSVFRTIVFICLLPILLLSLVFVGYYIAENEKQTQQTFESNRHLTVNQLHQLFDSYESETQALLQNTNSLFSESDFSDIYINSVLSNILFSYPEIEVVTFRRKNQDFFFESRSGFDETIYNRQYGFVDPTNRDLNIQPIKVETFLGEAKPLIALSRNVFNANEFKNKNISDEYLGTIRIFLRPDNIDEIIRTSDNYERFDYYLLYRGRVFYTSEKNQRHLSFTQTDLENSYHLELNKTKEISPNPSIYLNKMSIVSFNNQTDSLLKKPSYWIFILLGIFAAILIPLTIYFVIKKSILQPIQLLATVINEVQEKHEIVKTEQFPNNEIGYISHKMNLMLSELFDYHDKLMIAEVKQKESELKALKSQIQPHYLYNTLEVIRMSALINGNLTVAKMIQHLSKQLEYVLRENEEELTFVANEIANVTDYLELMNVRYEGNIHYSIQVEDSVRKIFVPRLSIQPIVENAIKHGLREKGNQGDILITGYCESDFCVLEIFDNGVGISKEKLESLDQKKKQPSNHLGIAIVHSRIQHHFGESFGVFITSQESEWTVVRIVLPNISKEEIQ